MFFILSKILSFLFHPFSWILILFIVSWISKIEKRKKLFFKIGVISLLFFTNSVIFLEFTRLWEPRGIKIEQVEHHDLGIVLGGMFEFDNSTERLSIRRGGDRIWQTIHLYHLGKIDKILITGDNGYVLDKGLNESQQLKEVMVDMGIPETDILVENKSKNTHENALFTKKIIDSLYSSPPKTLLITSALHMKRSKACFEKVGFSDFNTFSTDHYTGKDRNYFFDQYIIPNESNLTNWFNLIHEVSGYIIYWVMGYV